MTIGSHERIKLELSAQAFWQFPSFSREEVQLIVHVSRSLSDQFFCVGRSLLILNFQHITAIFHADVCSELAHNRDWCQRWNELLSSICRHGLLAHQESHHSVHTYDSSREIQILHNLGRANSTTGRNHVGRCHVHGHEAVQLDKSIAPSQSSWGAHHRLLCSSVRQATSWSQDQTNELRMLRIGVASHNSLGCTIVQHVWWQIMQLCKSISWQKKKILGWRLRECPSVLVSDTLSTYVQVLSPLKLWPKWHLRLMLLLYRSHGNCWRPGVVHRQRIQGRLHGSWQGKGSNSLRRNCSSSPNWKIHEPCIVRHVSM